MQSSEDLLLGKLAVREGLCTQADVDECLRLQAQRDPQPSLGDLLLFKGYLTAPQLKELLARQHKRVMSCTACSLSFTVLTLSDGKSARCPRCKGPLAETPPEGPTRTDAEIATQRMKVVPAAPGLVPPARKPVKITCVICDAIFNGVPEPSGRIKCPSCQSTFTGRR